MTLTKEGLIHLIAACKIAAIHGTNKAEGKDDHSFHQPDEVAAVTAVLLEKALVPYTDEDFKKALLM